VILLGKTRTGKRMNLITVHLPEQQVYALDELVKARIFPSRSEAIRAAIRDLVDRYAPYLINKYSKFSFPPLGFNNDRKFLMLGQR